MCRFTALDSDGKPYNCRAICGYWAPDAEETRVVIAEVLEESSDGARTIVVLRMTETDEDLACDGLKVVSVSEATEEDYRIAEQFLQERGLL